MLLGIVAFPAGPVVQTRDPDGHIEQPAVLRLARDPGGRPETAEAQQIVPRIDDRPIALVGLRCLQCVLDVPRARAAPAGDALPVR